MNHPADYMREVEELATVAINRIERGERPSDEEITALRFAAGIPSGAPRPVTVADEKEIELWH